MIPIQNITLQVKFVQCKWIADSNRKQRIKCQSNEKTNTEEKKITTTTITKHIQNNKEGYHSHKFGCDLTLHNSQWIIFSFKTNFEGSLSAVRTSLEFLIHDKTWMLGTVLWLWLYVYVCISMSLWHNEMVRIFRFA